MAPKADQYPTPINRQRTHWPLDMELLQLSPVAQPLNGSSPEELLFSWIASLASKSDSLTLDQILLSILILGGKGSGKTSGSMRAFRSSFLRENFGFLVLCAKPEAADEFEELAQECGRGHDVRRFSIENGSAFNPIDYSSKMHGSRMGMVVGLAAQFWALQEAIAQGAGQSSDEIWNSANRELLRQVFFTQMQARDSIRLVDTLKIVRSLPDNPGAFEDSREWERSQCLRFLLEAEEHTHPERRYEMEAAKDYFNEMAGMNSRTRTSVQFTASTFLSSFLSRPLLQLFGAGTTLTPDDVLDGRIVIIDVPVKSFEHEMIGRLAALIWKRATQQAIERRRKHFRGDPDSLRPVVIDMDEAQFFVSSDDAGFLSTSRSSRGLMLMASQSIPSFYASVGADGKGKAKVQEILASALVRVGHASLCEETNKWFCGSLGEVPKRMRSGGTTFGTSTSSGISNNWGRNNSFGRSNSEGSSETFGKSKTRGSNWSHSEGINGSNSSSVSGASSSSGWSRGFSFGASESESESTSHGLNFTKGTSSNHGTSFGGGSNQGTGQNLGFSESWTESMQLDIPPRKLVEQKRGGKKNGGKVTGLVMAGGERFRDGQLWMECLFWQKGWEPKPKETKSKEASSENWGCGFGCLGLIALWLLAGATSAVNEELGAGTAVAFFVAVVTVGSTVLILRRRKKNQSGLTKVGNR